MKQTYLTKLAIWFGLLFVLNSCTDNYMSPIEKGNFSVLTLQLPKETEVSINTRSVSSENAIEDILVVLFQNGQPKYQQFFNPAINDDALSITITDFSVQSRDSLFVYCNTGITTINATSADELAEQLVINNDARKLPMYGAGEVNEVNSISIELEYSLAKATVVCSAAGFTINKWKVSNVPSNGFIMERAKGYPSQVNLKEEVSPVNGTAYIVPRIDNSSSTGKERTYILVEMSDQKWYKLDFYNHSGNLDMGDQVPVLDIQRNTHYSFEITEIKSAGYTTEEEAAANDGSNVIYTMEITNGHGVSNGQYSLLLDNEKIVLYPVDDQHNEMDVLTVSAIIPKPENTLSTYYALIDNPGKNIKILDELSQPTDTLNLMNSGSLTTENSSRTIKLQFSTANVQDTYLEIHLGNIVKRIPITVESSNCYLMDFATKTGSRLVIPVIQANKDGVKRISPDDDLDACIVWSDQSNITESNLHVEYNKDKQWIEVVNDITFTGNVIIAIKSQNIIKWSWHIWALDANVLVFDSKHAVYDFLPEKRNVYNDHIFMDRNLGAYTLEKDGRVSDMGLQYQFGRKDPFPIGTPLTPLTIYHNGTSFTMDGNHPVWGVCKIERDFNNNLEYSIQNPIQMIIGNHVTSPTSTGNGDGDNYDWYTNDFSSMNGNLWLTKDLQKTAYNPCPIGWTTPYGGQIGPWYGIHISHGSLSDNGVTFSDAGYFPYSPYYTKDGKYQMLDKSTHLWWGYYNSNRNSMTSFYSNRVIVANVDVRASTHHVRCVREW